MTSKATSKNNRQTKHFRAEVVETLETLLLSVPDTKFSVTVTNSGNQRPESPTLAHAGEKLTAVDVKGEKEHMATGVFCPWTERNLLLAYFLSISS